MHTIGRLTGVVSIGVNDSKGRSRVIDLDIDIGVNAIDYKYVHALWFQQACAQQTLRLCGAIANQESLSGLETERRKLEGVIKEILNEME